MAKTPNFQSLEQKQQFRSICYEFVRLLFFIVILFGLTAYLGGLHIPRHESFFCDCESIIEYKSKSNFICQNQYFGKGNQQEKTIVFNGASSIKLTPALPYGLDFDYLYLQGNETIQVTAWRYNENVNAQGGVIVLQVDGIFWESGNTIIEEREDGWKKIELNYKIPMEAQHHPLKLFIWNNSSDTLYFDDLHIDIHRKDIL